MYDLIGDIHGHAEELVSLLELLGYRLRHGIYQHAARKVIFLGDFIDRGDQIREVLEVVRPMIDAGHALAVMGNHELNALAYHLEDPARPGEFVRPHHTDNTRQISKTLAQLAPDELREALAWMRTLPLWLDLPGLRVVHACWDAAAVARVARALEEHGGVTDSFLYEACQPGQPLFEPVEILLKGKEIPLPDGMSFSDKDGKVRRRTRVRWYLSPAGHSYASYALTDLVDAALPLPAEVLDAAFPYPLTEKPVFVGHYCLSSARPAMLAGNVACLDYCIAKNGALVAYRWEGEQTLRNDHFFRVEPAGPSSP